MMFNKHNVHGMGGSAIVLRGHLFRNAMHFYALNDALVYFAPILEVRDALSKAIDAGDEPIDFGYSDGPRGFDTFGPAASASRKRSYVSAFI